MARVTADLLRSLRACASEVAQFEDQWPDGCEVTAETLEQAHKRGLSVQWLAEHQHTPAEVLAALAKDADADVRWAAARNESTPAEVLAALAKDADVYVRRAAAGNAATRGLSVPTEEAIR